MNSILNVDTKRQKYAISFGNLIQITRPIKYVTIMVTTRNPGLSQNRAKK